MSIKIDPNGYPLLHIAAYRGEKEIVKWLLNRGVDINLVYNSGLEPDLNLDAEEGYETIVKTLAESKAAPDDEKALLEKKFFSSESDLDGVSALHLACKNGHKDVVELLIDRGAIVNNHCSGHYSQFRNEGMPISLAAAGGHKEIVELLIQRGAEVNTHCNNSPLYLAALYGHIDLVKTLIANGADCRETYCNAKNFFVRESVLHVAAREGNKEMLAIFIESGVDIDAQNSRGATALHIAAERGNKEILQQLVQRGAKLDIESTMGHTVFGVASSMDNEDIAKMLKELEPADEESNYVVDENSRKAFDAEVTLHDAAKEGNEELVRLLLDRGTACNVQNRYGGTVLHSAVVGGNEKIVNIFIERGVELNCCDRYGRTALYKAAIGEHAEIMKLLLKHGATINDNERDYTSVILGAVQAKNVQIMEILMERGFGFNNKRNNRGEAVLHVAAEHGTVEAVKLLIQNGAKVNVESRKWETPLHKAACRGNEEIVKLLLKKGAKIDHKCEIGETALHKAVYREKVDIAKLIIENGAKVNARCGRYETALHKIVKVEKSTEEIVDLLIKHGAHLNARNYLGETVMHKAIKRGDEELVKIMVDRGAAVNVQNYKGKTALHMAIKGGKEKLVELLLMHGADINLDDIHGKTALHKAAELGHEEITRHLISKGAQIDDKDSSGHTPLYFAFGLGSETVAKILINAGADINSMDNQGDTVLASAVKYQSARCVKFLLNYGMTVDIHTLLLRSMEDDDYMSLRFDREYMFDGYFNQILSGTPKNLVELLLDYGTTFDQVDKDVSAILSRAIGTGNEIMVQLLLEYKADINFENAAGESVIHQALATPEDEPHDCAAILTRYAVEMKFANSFVSETIFHDIDGNDELRAFKVKCENEIEQIKSVDEGIDYWKILTSNYSSVFFARNKDIVQAINSDECKKRFPIYSSIMKNQIRRGKWRNILLDKVKHFFKAVAKSEGNEHLPVLPRLCVDEIFSYLPNRDFRNLIKVCDPNKRFDFNLINVK